MRTPIEVRLPPSPGSCLAERLQFDHPLCSRLRCLLRGPIYAARRLPAWQTVDHCLQSQKRVEKFAMHLGYPDRLW